MLPLCENYQGWDPAACHPEVGTQWSDDSLRPLSPATWLSNQQCNHVLKLQALSHRICCATNTQMQKLRVVCLVIWLAPWYWFPTRSTESDILQSDIPGPWFSHWRKSCLYLAVVLEAITMQTFPFCGLVRDVLFAILVLELTSRRDAIHARTWDSFQQVSRRTGGIHDFDGGHCFLRLYSPSYATSCCQEAKMLDFLYIWWDNDTYINGWLCSEPLNTNWHIVDFLNCSIDDGLYTGL